MNDKLHKKDYFITFSLTFGLYLLKVFTVNTYILYPDQIGALATAIKLCQLPWNTAISYSKYYGFGFFGIYGLFFKMTDNPHVIIWINYLLITFLMALISCLILYIAVELLHNQKNILLYMLPAAIAFICSYHSFSSLLNAPIVYCSVWAAVCFLIKSSIENIYEKKLAFSVISAMCFLYILFLHETVIALYIALLTACVLVRVLWKEWIVSMVPFWSIIGGGFVFGRYFRNKVIDIVWSVKHASLGNTSAFQHTSMWFLESKETFRIFLDTVFTNFTFLNEATFGLAILAFVAAMWIVISFFVRQKLKKNIMTQDKIQFFITVTSLVTAVIIILGLGASWGRNAYQAYIGAIDVGSTYRGYAYGRYYMPYFAPALLIAVSYVMKIQRKSKIVFGAIVGYLTFMLYYLCIVHGYYFKNWGIARLARIIILENDIYGVNIFISIIIPLGMLIILYFKGHMFGKKAFMAVILFFTVIFPYFRQDFTCPVIEDNTYPYYNFGQQILNNGFTVEEGYAASGRLCRIQFELQNMEIKELSSDLDEDIIAFVMSEEEAYVLEMLQMNNLKKVYLNENLLVIYRGDYYEKIMDELGYEAVEAKF